MKSFSEQERGIIKTKLYRCCEESWSKYGYKKTNIRELCAMTGISTGAFYLFFPSKEHLFYETAQYVGDRIGAIFYNEIPKNPTKYDFAADMKKMFAELEKVEWYLTLQNELEQIVRKLPQGYIESTLIRDRTDLSELIKRYCLVPKTDLDTIIKTFSLLSLSILHRDLLGEGFDAAFSFLLDITVENMFE
ncbi:MAG: TetR/AcrR family transcriptional regulator [Treponema sp.]|nr:TetR/AcrR family transcriptional regulator [Treponema sp.]